MKTIITKIYEFIELSDSAKQTARQWCIDNCMSEWCEQEIEELTEFASMIGFTDFKIYFSGFSSQGDGACFTGNYKYNKNSVKLIKEFAPLDKNIIAIAKSFQEMQKLEFYRLTAKVSHCGNYYHENSMQFDFSRSDNKVLSKESTEYFKDFARYIYKALEENYTFQTSDVCVDENLSYNEIYFYENGKFAQ